MDVNFRSLGLNVLALPPLKSEWTQSVLKKWSCGIEGGVGFHLLLLGLKRRETQNLGAFPTLSYSISIVP